MTIRLIRPWLGGGMLLFAIVTPVAVPAAPTMVLCSPTKLKASVSAAESSTTSSAYENIPESQVSFVQGGNAPSCVIVRFSVEALAAGADNALEIRAFMGNITAGRPGSVLVGDRTGEYRGYSYEFVFPSVAPGFHTIRMQGRSTVTGQQVSVRNHNTVVQFAP